MGNSVCRAITLYSYHIPIQAGNLTAQYSTLGFFDGMSTELLEIDYAKDDLRSLWEYTMELNVKCDGSYSFQNIFVMADDTWNEGYTDQEIWKEETNLEYPLTIVVFLQLKEYMSGEDNIQGQCKKFTHKAMEYLEEGQVYTYASVDKNDFVVCLKCRNYHNAVKTIKALHTTGKKIVYSYSVFSVSHAMLRELSRDQYGYLFNETIESICLKGITNSISSKRGTFKWDDKYYAFCEKLAASLYTDKEREERIIDETGKIEVKSKDRIYDILGDNDFRYIARDVNLGKLLCEFKEGGILSYLNEEFSYYLFSSSLVLNTSTPIGSMQDDEEKQQTERPIYCEQAASIMKDIEALILRKEDKDSQIFLVYYALHQLLQSFKVLEVSPAKRYDFFSMFHPFKMLLNIVKEKLEEGEAECLSENDDLFDFIHKISMAFHSAQRTDIQFFQIQDFNVIVHYSPAKLRAFYAVWILKLAELYKAFKVKQDKKYSFIFSPGMFDIALVRQLFPNGREKNRLMLVTLPDSSIYKIKWLPIVLSHEAAHIGCERKREKRHRTALEVCARVVLLEMHAFMLYGICTERELVKPEIVIQTIHQNKELLGEVWNILKKKADEILEKIEPEERDDECRREKSIYYIIEIFRYMRKYYGKKIIAQYCCSLKNICIKCNKKNVDNNIKDITLGFNGIQIDLHNFLHLFIEMQLDNVLEVFYYIEEEAYADLITILTLEHSMKEYLEFCAYAEKAEDVPEQGEAVIVRMAMVIETACNIAEDEWIVNNKLGFTGKWKQNRLESLCGEFPKDSKEGRLAAKILYYTQYLRDSMEDISKYEREYDPVAKGFDKKVYDFLNDQAVWFALNGYLYECAKEYINKVKNDDTIRKEQQEMAKVYRQLHNDSYLDVIQVIEKFLSMHANEHILKKLDE